MSSVFTLVVLGDHRVGKTSLVEFFRCVYNNSEAPTFSEISSPTVGASIYDIIIDSKYDQRIYLKVIDTSGQKRYQQIAEGYMKTASGFLVVFDVTNRKSFEEACKICFEIKNSHPDKLCCTALVGNKCDLEISSVLKQELTNTSMSYPRCEMDTKVQKRAVYQTYRRHGKRKVVKTYEYTSPVRSRQYNFSYVEIGLVEHSYICNHYSIPIMARISIKDRSGVSELFKVLIDTISFIAFNKYHQDNPDVDEPVVDNNNLCAMLSCLPPSQSHGTSCLIS